MVSLRLNEEETAAWKGLGEDDLILNIPIHSSVRPSCASSHRSQFQKRNMLEGPLSACVANVGSIRS